MKKLLCLLPLFIFLSCSKTKPIIVEKEPAPKLKTGVVDYQIQLETKETIDPDKFGKMAKATFNESQLHFVKVDGEDTGSFQLVDLKSGVETNYLDFRDKKYALQTSSDMIPPIGELTFHEEEKVIAGYNCQKATASMGDGEMIAWFTKDIGVDFCPYVSAKGFALEYTLLMGYGKVTYTATQVNLQPVDSTLFQPSEEYKSITMKELQEELMGGPTMTSFEKGQPIDNFDLTDMAGNSVKLSDFKGKVLLINFWFINCPPCRMEMPDLNQLKEEYKGEDVAFLAITFDPKSRVADFLEKTSFNFQIIPDARKIIETYGIMGFPTSVVLNREGIVVNSKMGGSMNIKEELKAFIEEAKLQ